MASRDGATLLFGYEVNGARLWIDLGPVSVQPGEPLKIVVFAPIHPDYRQRYPDVVTWLDEERAVVRAPSPFPLGAQRVAAPVAGSSCAYGVPSNCPGSTARAAGAVTGASTLPTATAIPTAPIFLFGSGNLATGAP